MPGLSVYRLINLSNDPSRFNLDYLIIWVVLTVGRPIIIIHIVKLSLLGLG